MHMHSVICVLCDATRHRSCISRAQGSSLRKAKLTACPPLRVPAVQIVGSVCACGNANPDEPRTCEISQSGSFTARHMLQLGVSLACAVPASRRRACRRVPTLGLLPASCPSARRRVRVSIGRYGQNRSVEMHVSWPDTRQRVQVQVC